MPYRRAGRELRIFLQCPQNERQVVVELRRPLRGDTGQASLRQHPFDSTVMHAEMARDGAASPFLRMVKA